jgi:hypothetical protein
MRTQRKAAPRTKLVSHMSFPAVDKLSTLPWLLTDELLLVPVEELPLDPLEELPLNPLEELPAFPGPDAGPPSVFIGRVVRNFGELESQSPSNVHSYTHSVPDSVQFAEPKVIEALEAKRWPVIVQTLGVEIFTFIKEYLQSPSEK